MTKNERNGLTLLEAVAAWCGTALSHVLRNAQERLESFPIRLALAQMHIGTTPALSINNHADRERLAQTER